MKWKLLQYNGVILGKWKTKWKLLYGGKANPGDPNSPKGLGFSVHAQSRCYL